MFITAGVGRHARNDREDVKSVQMLLNANLDRIPGIEKLDEDGLIGGKTISAIEAFQRDVVGMAAPNGQVFPDGSTIPRLLEPVPTGFSAETLRLIMVDAAPSRRTTYLDPLRRHMADRDINTPLRQAHFLAQIAHESGHLNYAEEIASGRDYEGRTDLGNTEPGDGRRFKGRGLIQLTGRANYTSYGQAIGRDLTVDDNWELVASDPELAVDVACWFWATRKLNGHADRDDIRKITRRINGGYNGLDDRIQICNRARAILVR
ncbi:MAG: glycoside hydrolase family 19 protein [Alphaproteobacteria bacterium]|nr:glycoside hydrolase family 19 protein [Alphaproteobacteria bacterium]